MFYARFEAMCQARGVSVSRAAMEAGINKSAVTYWKGHAEARPTGQIAQRLCAYFGVSMSQLYGEADAENAPAQEGARVMSYDDFTYAMQSEAAELTEGDKSLLLSMARQLNAARKKKESE